MIKYFLIGRNPLLWFKDRGLKITIWPFICNSKKHINFKIIANPLWTAGNQKPFDCFDCDIQILTDKFWITDYSTDYYELNKREGGKLEKERSYLCWRWIELQNELNNCFALLQPIQLHDSISLGGFRELNDKKLRIEKFSQQWIEILVTNQ